MSSRTPTSAVFRTVLAYESRKRLRMAATLAAMLSFYGIVFVAIGPDLLIGTELSELLTALPDAVSALIGFEYLDSVEGLLASEFYTFGWVIGLAAYVAYAAASAVGGDVESGRMELLVSGPVSRTGVLFGTVASVLIPIVVVNAVVPLALFAGGLALGQELSLADFLVFHAISVVYLLAWTGIGTLVGVVVGRGRTAGRLTIALAFAAWIGEAFVSTTEFSALGALSPARHFDPPAILVAGEIDPIGIAVLAALAVGTFALARTWFLRGDL